MFTHEICATYLSYPHIFKCDPHDIAQTQPASACIWHVCRVPYPNSGTAKHLDRKNSHWAKDGCVKLDVPNLAASKKL